MNQNNNDIPNDYIAYFMVVQLNKHIYIIDNRHANSSFKYINVVSTTESWGSSNWKQKVTYKWEFEWTDGVFSEYVYNELTEVELIMIKVFVQ